MPWFCICCTRRSTKSRRAQHPPHENCAWEAAPEEIKSCSMSSAAAKLKGWVGQADFGLACRQAKREASISPAAGFSLNAAHSKNCFRRLSAAACARHCKTALCRKPTDMLWRISNGSSTREKPTTICWNICSISFKRFSNTHSDNYANSRAAALP